MPDHALALTPAGFSCTVCHWSWDHLPSTRCPGVTRYHDRTHAALLFDVARPMPAGCAETHAAHLRQDDAETALCWALRLLNAPDTWLVVDACADDAGNAARLMAIAIAAPDGTQRLNVRLRKRRQAAVAWVPPPGPGECSCGAALALEQLYPALARITAENMLVCYEARVQLLVERAIRKAHLPPLAATWQVAADHYARWVNDAHEDHRYYRPRALPHATHEPAADCRALLALIETMAQREYPDEEDRPGPRRSA